MKEENPEKKQGFANAVAYYMKLTYSNWHKELVHDDAIQAELSTMTKGELEFNNRPFVKHRVDIRDENEYGKRPAGGYRKNFSSGGRDNRNAGGRDNNRNAGGGGNRDNRGGNRDNRGGNSGGNGNNNNRNFKKRY